MMIKNTLYLLFASMMSLCNCAQTVITTSLNSIEERSVAVVDQESFISAVMLDAATNYARYTTVMANDNLEFPAEIEQFIINIASYEVSDFPTSIYISTFPFEEFQTFITHFSWIFTYMDEYSMTTFKIPADYSVLTTTIELDIASTAITSISSAITSIVSSTANPYSSVATAAAVSSYRQSTLSTSKVASSSNVESKSASSSSAAVSTISTTSQNAALMIVPNTILFLLVSLLV